MVDIRVSAKEGYDAKKENNNFVYDTEEVYCVWQNSLKENNEKKIPIVTMGIFFF